MASTRQVFRSRFADAVVKGDVISLRRDGDESMTVYAPPVKVNNLVGHRSHVLLHVQLNGTETTGQMILSSSNVVFIQDRKA